MSIICETIANVLLIHFKFLFYTTFYTKFFYFSEQNRKLGEEPVGFLFPIPRRRSDFSYLLKQENKNKNNNFDSIGSHES